MPIKKAGRSASKTEPQLTPRRNRIVCYECQRAIVRKKGFENYYITVAVPGEDEAFFHPKCFAVGDGFDDLEWRTRWLLRLITASFKTFRTKYDANEVPSLAAGFWPDLSRDLFQLTAEVCKIQEQASKLSPQETAALFLPISSDSGKVGS